MSSNDPNETLRAENNPKFYTRFIWLGLAAIGFLGWCEYDALVKWPDQMVRSHALVELAEESLTEEEIVSITSEAHDENERYLMLSKHVTEDEELSAKWSSLAEENGWPEEPSPAHRGEPDIVMQHVMAGVSGLAAVWLLTTVLLARGRWIQLSDGEISTSWGQTFPVSGVTKIEKRQWRDKGIARLRYEHEGRKGKFVVDDYKFHRKTTDEILRRIELIAGEDKITGGPPEEAPADDDTVRQQADQTVMDAQAHS